MNIQILLLKYILTKLVKKSNAIVIFNTHKKKQIGPPQKKTNGSEDDQIIQNLETNRKKTLVTLSKNFSISRLTIRRFGCIFPPWL